MNLYRLSIIRISFFLIFLAVFCHKIDAETFALPLQGIQIRGYVSDVEENAQQNSNHTIWYTEPANARAKDSPDGWKSDEEWLKAIPLGNGSLGAMVFGDVGFDRIQLNEISLWSGSVDDGDNPMASASLPIIRNLLFQGKYKEATELTNKTQITKGQGSGHGNGANVPFGSFQTLGDIWFDFQDKSPYSNYKRELDLMNGIASIRYVQQGVQFKREIFISHPSQVMVINLTASQAKKISFSLAIDRPERYITYSAKDRLIMEGTMTNGAGGNGMLYKAVVLPQIKGGQLREEEGKLHILEADEVTLIISAKTNYKLDYPTYLNPRFREELDENINQAGRLNYTTIKNLHVKDFNGFMGRVEFTLSNAVNDIPTNDLLKEHAASGSRHAIYPLYFQFGRYLLLSSSREGGLPANLQGIWANKIQTPWNGDYHTDINVQMNYWPAEVTNLSESHKPLIDLIESLIEPGKKTAKIQYDMRGWVVHPITNVWGYTSPGESASWGMHIGGSGWLALHLWEHYLFSEDRAYLKRIYPWLLEASQFYLDWLVKDPKTRKLVSGPSPSPENSFVAPDGLTAQISMGPTHDQQVIDNLFGNTIRAASLLNKDQTPTIEQIKHAKENLLISQVGSDGRLMEWAFEFEEVEPTHRHLSHLFAMYPAAEITLRKTPALADAVKKSLIHRGDDGVGWTYAWKIALWARLKNADKALQLLNKQLRPTYDMSTKYSSGGGTYYNLFGACPPFQIDGNFGVIAGMAEMLLQSHDDCIDLLPALPREWPSGKIEGLVARGGVEVGMEWDKGELRAVTLLAKHDKECFVEYRGKQIKINLKKGEQKHITAF